MTRKEPYLFAALWLASEPLLYKTIILEFCDVCLLHVPCRPTFSIGAVQFVVSSSKQNVDFVVLRQVRDRSDAT